MIETTKNMLDATVQQALDLAKSANSAFRAPRRRGGGAARRHVRPRPQGSSRRLRPRARRRRGGRLATVTSRTCSTATAGTSCGAGWPRSPVAPQLRRPRWPV